MFRRYHYLNSDLSASAICYALYDDDTAIGFMAVLHQPNAINKRIKRCSRLVILPDYQGIGLGRRFLEAIAEIYAKDQYTFTVVTSAKNMIMALAHSDKWEMCRYSANKSSNKTDSIDFRRKSMRTQNRTASFRYKANLI